jgi:hypothetical protein
MPPRTGHFVLHTNVLPKITAGRYELVSEQRNLPFEVEPEHTHLQVAAPRYVMPTDQILSTFPPANAEGAFGDRLPQIVLKRRTLPWERNPAGAVAPSPTPWLALVVVAEGEAELSQTKPVAECVTPGTTLLDPADKDVDSGLYLAVTETVVKKIFPCAQDLPLLTHVREVDVDDTELANGDDDGWLAVVLANRLPVFDAANDRAVRYMACLVNLEGQLAALPPPTPPSPVFEFALAQDWRLLDNVATRSGPDAAVIGGAGQAPLAAVLNTRAAPSTLAARGASLHTAAALDGSTALSTQPKVATQWQQATKDVAAAARDPDAARLVRDTMARGFRLPIELFALEKTYRFPVLAHWSFTTRGNTSFKQLMQGLDVSLLGHVPPKAPDAPAAGAQPEVVHTGHIGLAQRTRRGDPQRAWYRGPCVPFPTRRNGQSSGDGALPLAHSADQLRRVIPDGREDLALAAAFEIGRLLALSQLSVVSALLRFRAEQFGAGRVREILAQVMPFELPSFGRERVDVGRFAALQMLDVMAKNAPRMVGPRRPVADPGRPLRVDGDLDRVVAAGLGLDINTLRRRADEVGMAAALATTAAPLGFEPEQPSSHQLVLPALRSALQAELLRTLQVALPAGAAGPAAPGGGMVGPVRGRRVQPDALDALLAALAPADDEDDEMPEDRR